MSAPAERHTSVGGEPCRVWEKGEGEPIGFLAGFGGLPRWIPFLDALAEERRVVVPSLPGFPGATGHDQLDDVADWVTATLDLLDGAGLDGADLIGASVGGLLAAEVAAFSGASVRRLALLAPLGLFHDDEPVADVFARLPHQIPDLLCAEPDVARALFAAPEDADPVEWQILMTRASEAAARLLWPLGDRGLTRRLHRIRANTLLLWGAEDQVVPASYAKRFGVGIAGPSVVQTIAGAGHLAYLDRPDEVARAILSFMT